MCAKLAITLIAVLLSGAAYPQFTRQQAINLVNTEEGVFLDLRDAAEFKKGHIVGAVNVPSAKLPERMVELEKYMEKPIVLVCKMGQQSGAAGKQLQGENYTKGYKMSGGMMEWTNLQLPLLPDTRVPL